MNRGIFLSAAALMMLAGPAMAQNRCVTPNAPLVPDGKTATAAQLIATSADVKKFIKDSDDYQNCLLTDLATQQDQAKKDKKELDPTVKAAIESKGDSNQKDKERVGKEYNAAAVAYRAAHPK
jgi:hypothetical protein